VGIADRGGDDASWGLKKRAEPAFALPLWRLQAETRVLVEKVRILGFSRVVAMDASDTGDEGDESRLGSHQLRAAEDLA
jgi:hypothetical protein